MIRFNQANAHRVHDIYNEERCKPDMNVLKLLELLRYFNTYDVSLPVLSARLVYWEFLHACLNSIITNSWTTLPGMWLQTFQIRNVRTLTARQIDNEYTRYLMHREEVCRKLGLSPYERDDRVLLLRWVQNLRAEQHLMGIAHTLLHGFIYYSSSESTQVPYNTMNPNEWAKNESFDGANQELPPLHGNNKYEVMKYNFNSTPKERNEALI